MNQEYPYFITDYVKTPSIETDILGPPLDKAFRHRAKILLVWHEIINEQYLSLFKDLQGVIRYGVGYDNINVLVLKERGIVFCNGPDYGTQEVSDTAITMIMCIARGVVRYDCACRHYPDSSWQENTDRSLVRTSRLVLGIIGAGRIGGSVALKARLLGMQVIIFDPYQPSGIEKMLGVQRVYCLDDLLKVADIISLHTPLTKETAGMVNSDFLSKMKQGSSLVNTARGELIANLDDIHQAMQVGKLANIALDVLPEEPPCANHPLIKSWRQRAHWQLGRIIINPHTSYYSQDSYNEMREKAALNAKRIIDGVAPLNRIE